MTLVRNLLTNLDRNVFDVYAYCLYNEDSWWAKNVSAEVTGFR